MPDAAPKLATEERAGQWGAVQQQREARRAALARAAEAIDAERRRAAEMEERRLRRTAVEEGVSEFSGGFECFGKGCCRWM